MSLALMSGADPTVQELLRTVKKLRRKIKDEHARLRALAGEDAIQMDKHIKELARDNAALLAENQRLRRELAKRESASLPDLLNDAVKGKL